MIFPVGSDNAKEGYRLRTSIGWPAWNRRFFCLLTSLNTDFFLPFLIQSRKSKKRAWEIDLKIPTKDTQMTTHVSEGAGRERHDKRDTIFLAWKRKCWQARHVKRDLRVCLNNRDFLAFSSLRRSRSPLCFLRQTYAKFNISTGKIKRL